MKKPIKIFPLTKLEQKKYVMPTNKDYEILSKVKQLEVLKLSKHDNRLVWLIKTQLESDWRKPLIKTLKKLIQEYKK